MIPTKEDRAEVATTLRMVADAVESGDQVALTGSLTFEKYHPITKEEIEQWVAAPMVTVDPQHRDRISRVQMTFALGRVI